MRYEKICQTPRPSKAPTELVKLKPRCCSETAIAPKTPAHVKATTVQALRRDVFLISSTIHGILGPRSEHIEGIKDYLSVRADSVFTKLANSVRLSNGQVTHLLEDHLIGAAGPAADRPLVVARGGQQVEMAGSGLGGGGAPDARLRIQGPGSGLRDFHAPPHVLVRAAAEGDAVEADERQYPGKAGEPGRKFRRRWQCGRVGRFTGAGGCPRECHLGASFPAPCASPRSAVAGLPGQP